MPNPVLYVLPEDHADKHDQERKIALVNLAKWGAINVLLENTLCNDMSGQSVNLYGIENEASIKIANLFLHYQDRVRGIGQLAQKVATQYPNIPAELQQARLTTLAEFKKMKQDNLLPKQSTRGELKQYIGSWPAQPEDEIREKYIFYKRNHKIAQNIRNVVSTVLSDPKKPRVFALSIGAFHIDSTNLTYSNQYQGKKDLPTILGDTITMVSGTTNVVYGNQTVHTIATKALELSDNLPWTERWPAQARLKVYIATGC